ncbi:hypothetical protein GMORB2_0562 [Geosmithia morbida]|uniref:DUF7730 domain-containing protein n=1 Tax=Geosmithia morbida TaxID=1094350 RepID=A0A9P4Z1F7_9HYPO|nr:uncharacterized protein GMORB2_0562 [Geosmithia morbida]KAF4126825.1 hypothetical protein GMORB2_0562 [Geosmithia morbida]
MDVDMVGIRSAECPGTHQRLTSHQDFLAFECRDKEDQARAAYNGPLRRTNRTLVDENMRLKRLLRENGIAWSAVSQDHLVQPNKRKTRSSMTSQDLGRPHLPVEVILRILHFAMMSPHPIIDPLSALTPANLSEDERARGNQIAIHFLATCRSLYTEGIRMLWSLNTFVFTTPEAVRAFGELNAEYRSRISHVNFRIVARYYDDQDRKHRLGRSYHRHMKKEVKLRVEQRPKEVPIIRGGFRSYTWNQVADFLTGLRAPYDPSFHLKSTPRPKLLPSLTSLRLDLVNFSDTVIPFSGPDFHDITSHEFGCNLNEIQVTGMPHDDPGMKASAELSGLLKDEGLYLDGQAAFVAPVNRPLIPLKGDRWCSRVVRAQRESSYESDSEFDMIPDTIFSRGHAKIGIMPPAPAETGHPTSTRPDDVVIWKRVPTSRDSDERVWVQFCRHNGYEMTDRILDHDLCPCCGDPRRPNNIDFSDEDDDDLD